MTLLRRRKCQHRWAGWWIVGDHATNECLWCKAKWHERLAVPAPFRPLRRRRHPTGPRGRSVT